jgi:hypothetical protein
MGEVKNGPLATLRSRPKKPEAPDVRSRQGGLAGLEWLREVRLQDAEAHSGRERAQRLRDGDGPKSGRRQKGRALLHHG